MTPSTFAEWVDAMRALRVAGVSRHYGHIPRSVDTADLPAFILGNHTINSDTRRASCDTLAQAFSTEVMILIEPVNQELADNVYELGAELGTNLLTEFDTLTVCNFRDVTAQTTDIELGGTAYRGILATVAGNNGE